MSHRGAPWRARQRHHRLASIVLVGLLAALIVAGLPQPARALPASDAVVGPPCDETGFNAALEFVQHSGGGTITFDCGTATVAFTSHKVITGDVIVDGGDRITLDGGNVTRLFYVGGTGQKTVRNHVSNIFAKLQVADRAQAMDAARRAGLGSSDHLG